MADRGKSDNTELETFGFASSGTKRSYRNSKGESVSKEDAIKKVKEILAKDKRFNGAKIEVTFKNKREAQNEKNIKEFIKLIEA